MMFIRIWVSVVRIIYVILDLVSVVFFKQKTAYEMRISDWSSDVCSSDRAGRANHLIGAFETDELGPLAGRRLCHLQCHFGMDTLTFARREIGRASCRERVCQYV